MKLMKCNVGLYLGAQSILLLRLKDGGIIISFFSHLWVSHLEVENI
jgi:hypothetical protein